MEGRVNGPSLIARILEHGCVNVINITVMPSTPCLKKPDAPIMSHNSSKNRTVSMIFEIFNQKLSNQ